MPRPMVVRFGALGDMVLMTVAIRRLSERYGSPVDVVGSGTWTRPLLEGQAGVGEIFLTRSRRSPYWLDPGQWRLLKQLKRRGAGPTWLFDAQIDKLRWLLSRAGWRSGQLVTLDRLADVAGEHFCDRWQRFVQLDPERAEPSLPDDFARQQQQSALPMLRVPRQGREQLQNLERRLQLAGRPIILIQAGNKRTMRRGDPRRRSNIKYWPEAWWAEVLRALRGLYPDHLLLLIGAPEEAAFNEDILALSATDGACNVATAMTVPLLMALCERAAGLISVDTGPAHVAAAIGCAALVLYTSPGARQIYGVRAKNHPVAHLIGGTDEEPSLMGITSESLIETWKCGIAAQLRRRPGSDTGPDTEMPGALRRT